MKNVCVDIGGYSPKCPIPQDEIFLTLDISNKFLRKNQCNINENRTFVDIINTALDHVQLRSSQGWAGSTLVAKSISPISPVTAICVLVMFKCALSCVDWPEKHYFVLLGR